MSKEEPIEVDEGIISPGKKKKDPSPGSKASHKKVKPNESEKSGDEGDRLSRLENLIMDMHKEMKENFTQTLAAQTAKIDLVSAEVQDTKHHVEALTKDMNTQKDEMNIMQAKMLSMTDEFANLKKTKTNTASVPFTPPRANGGGGSSSGGNPGQAKNDPFKNFPSTSAWGPPPPQSSCQSLFPACRPIPI